MLPELHTERLVMRELSLEDGPVLQAFQNRPEHLRHQAVEPEEFADGTSRVQRYYEHRGPDSARRILVYVAHHRTRATVIGDVGLSRFFHPALASLGFGISSEYWGQGYATEMSSRLVEFGFDALNLHRISADVAVENAPCRRVLEKIGFVHEGTARDCIWAQGHWWTEAKYALLAREYENLRESSRQSARDITTEPPRL
jgi:[ribosomal protein S5]-alanine N-acetyltransferase